MPPGDGASRWAASSLPSRAARSSSLQGRHCSSSPNHERRIPVDDAKLVFDRALEVQLGEDRQIQAEERADLFDEEGPAAFTKRGVAIVCVSPAAATVAAGEM